MDPVQVIIMAAGKGTRLKSNLPKVLHPLFGKPLLHRVLESLNDLAVDQCAVVVGHGKEQVIDSVQEKDWADAVKFVTQEPQLGTGHAVLQVKQHADVNLSGDVLILSGDVPLLSGLTIDQLVQVHRKAGNELTLLTADLDSPKGYGRVITDANGRVEKVVEEKDATPEEKQIRTVNAGVYCLRWDVIAPFLEALSSDNAQGELYLTDVVAMAVSKGLMVGAVKLANPLEMCGINHRLDLAMCHEILNQEAQARCLDNGVSILNPGSTVMSPETVVGQDTIIYPGCYFEGDVKIGANCKIGPNATFIGPVTIGDNTTVMQSHVSDSTVGEQCHVGPFAQLRDGVEIKDRIKIGNFVEVKNSVIEEDTFVSHLSYIGDAELGKDVNMGAGSITANFDPIRNTKDKTIIEDGVKVGCNSVLVAPVTIGERSCVAAGSVITKTVKPWDLAIARGRQTQIDGWVKKQTETVKS